MKIRSGFVSNSSSSSFCVIGTTYNIEEIAKKDGINDESFRYGVADGKVLQYHGNGFGEYDDEVIGGLDAAKVLETMTIPEAKLHLQKLIKTKFKIDVPLDQISFEFGERGND